MKWPPLTTVALVLGFSLVWGGAAMHPALAKTEHPKASGTKKKSGKK
jgi:hypothetical protein